MSFYSYDREAAFYRSLDRMIDKWENLEPPCEDPEKDLDVDIDYDYFDTNEESDGGPIPRKP